MLTEKKRSQGPRSNQNEGLLPSVCTGCEMPGFKDMSRFQEFQGREVEDAAAEGRFVSPRLRSSHCCVCSCAFGYVFCSLSAHLFFSVCLCLCFSLSFFFLTLCLCFSNFSLTGFLSDSLGKAGTVSMSIKEIPLQAISPNPFLAKRVFHLVYQKCLE